jgi:hypothetical protein
MTDLKVEMIYRPNLLPYARNSRTHSPEQIQQIVASIKEFGFTNPVLIDADNGIIAGHGRVEAAALMGIPEIPCIRLGHLTPAQKRAYIIADNKLAENIGWNYELLRLEVQELQEMDYDTALLGFGDELPAIMAEPGTEGLTDPDDVPDVPVEPVTKPGDIWLLGKHRVMCGDCRDILPTLTGVDAVITDPPYGMKWDGKVTPGKVNGHGGGSQFWGQNIIGDAEVFDPSHLIRFEMVIIWGMHHFPDKLHRGTVLIWPKKYPDAYGTFLSDGDVAWMKGGHGVYISPTINPASFQSEKCHPTQKPVNLITWCMEKAKVPEGATVLDPYLGSGTTLIAAEKTGRICYGMEISPAYCDVIVKRWEQFTGQTATLENR